MNTFTDLFWHDKHSITKDNQHTHGFFEISCAPDIISYS